MPSVRVVDVSGKQYLQVVEYYRRPNGKQSVRVLKSFGRYNIENWLKANQFSVAYDQLKSIAAQASTNKSNLNELLGAALTVFGIILGATLVAAIIRDIFGEK